MNVQSLRTLLPLLPNAAKSVGISDNHVAELEKTIAEHTPYLLELFELIQKDTAAERRKTRYRRVREEASMTALHALAHSRADLLAGPNGFASLAEQSLKLGEAFAEAWSAKLEELEAREDAALEELEKLTQSASAAQGEPS